MDGGRAVEEHAAFASEMDRWQGEVLCGDGHLPALIVMAG